MARKESTKELSALAAHYLRKSNQQMLDAMHEHPEQFCEEVREMAASVLAQDETKGD